MAVLLLWAVWALRALWAVFSHARCLPILKTMSLTFYKLTLFQFIEGDTSLTIVQLRLFRLSKKVHMNKDAQFNWSFIDALSKEYVLVCLIKTSHYYAASYTFQSKLSLN